MTTAEFIKILQKADPKGTAHIRMEGGIPLFAELKEGYWDGPYTYYDEDGNYVYSTKGNKVDIHCSDMWDFVERNYSHGETTFEDIEKKFKFELGYSIESQRKEREQVKIDAAKEAFDSLYEIEESMYQKQLLEAKERGDNGWKWFQNKEVDNKIEGKFNNHMYYTWIMISPDGIEDKHSTPWKITPVLKSRLWEKVDNNEKEGYYEWVYKK